MLMVAPSKTERFFPNPRELYEFLPNVRTDIAVWHSFLHEVQNAFAGPFSSPTNRCRWYCLELGPEWKAGKAGWGGGRVDSHGIANVDG